MPFADLPPVPPALIVPDFDLAEAGEEDGRIDLRTIRPRCLTSKAGEIVVCARDPEEGRADKGPKECSLTLGGIK